MKLKEGLLLVIHQARACSAPGSDLALIINLYGLKAPVKQYGRVYLVFTPKGPKILKPLRYGSLNSFYTGKLLTLGEELPFLPRLHHSLVGSYYAYHKGTRYLLTDFVAGREADYYNQSDWQTAIGTMKEYHHFFQQEIKSNGPKWQPLHFNGSRAWQERLTEMVRCREIASQRPDHFSRQYQKEWRYFTAQGDRALTIFEKATDLLPQTICYHDWACHNLIVNQERASLIDFDYLIVDYTVHDKANLIGKYLKINGYQVKALLKALWDFDRIYPWQKGEIKLLLAYLTFPYDYWMWGRQYFLEKQPWGPKYFAKQWQRKIAGEKERRLVLDVLERIE